MQLFIFLIFLFTLFIQIPCFGAATDFVETWESFDVGIATDATLAPRHWERSCAEDPYIAERLQISTEQARSGTKSIRLEVRPHEVWNQNDTENSRCIYQSDHGSVTMADEVWHAYSMYEDSPDITPPVPTAEDLATNIGGWHPGNCQPSGAVSRRLFESDDATTVYLGVIRRYGSNDCKTDTLAEADTYCANGCNYVVNMGSIADHHGRWTDWVERIKYDATPPYNGIWQVWINGILTLNLVDIEHGFSDDPTAYNNYGVYRGNSDESTFIYYHDENRRRMAADGGSYATVCPTIHPKAPSIVYPAGGNTRVPVSFALKFSPYVEGYDVTDIARAHILDYQEVFSHYDSEFEISTSSATDSDGGFTTTVWTGTKASGDLTLVNVTGLVSGTTYYVHARYRNTAGVDRDFDGVAPPTDTDDMYWGPWSSITTFTTATFNSTPLVKYTNNSRYFMDKDGKPVYFAGNHVWSNVQDISYSPTMQDFQNSIAWFKSYGNTFTRLWTNFGYRDRELYIRTGPGNAADGGGLKFDLSQFNQAYFDDLRARIIYAQSQGMYCSLMFFGTLIQMHNYPADWDGYCWNPGNIINSVSWTAADATTFWTPNTASMNFQKMLIAKTIDTVYDLDNVIFEIANEASLCEEFPDLCDAGQDWQETLVAYVKAYEYSKYGKNHPVGITGGFDFGSSMLTRGADWFSPDAGPIWDNNTWRTGLPAASQSIPGIIDTDHLYTWGTIDSGEEGQVEPWVWKVITRGYQPLFMEGFTNQDYSASNRPWVEEIRQRVGQTTFYSGKIDLANATPTSSTSDCSTGFLLRHSGRRYLAYQPNHDVNFTINLPAGDYSYQWYDPTDGAVDSTSFFEGHGGGNYTFNPPASISNDAVLFVADREGGYIFEPFEDNDIDTSIPCPWWSVQEYLADRVTTSTTVARDGSRSAKFIQIDTDPEVAGGPRAEISESSSAGGACNRLDSGVENWQGFSYYYPAGNQDADWEIFMQWHATSGGSPPMSLSQDTGIWKVSKISGTLVNPSSVSYSLDDLTDEGSKWIDWVVRLKFGSSSQGILQVYKDGVLVVNVPATDIGYSDDPNNNYLKHGIYRFSNIPATSTRYIDEVRSFRQSEGGSYAAVCPTIRPKAPSIVYPIEGSISIPKSFTLDYGVYEEGYIDSARQHITDVRNVFSHYDSQFEISDSPAIDSSGRFLSLTWSGITNSGDLTQKAVTNLQGNKTYYVHARYRNTAGVDRDFDGINPPTDTDDMYWGPWSSITTFTTEQSYNRSIRIFGNIH